MSAAAERPLAEEVASRRWYHTMEIAPGVVTPGYFDTRAAAPRVPMPARLDGRRCLDVGTYDGFWAFEMERRGAAEVVAIDVLDPERWDWPADADAATVREMGDHKRAGDGFAFARQALGSAVERLDVSVYELDPALHGSFDLVYVGSLLLHLRDPVGALARVREVCRGEAVLCDAIDPVLSRTHPRTPVATLDGRGRPWWWKPNAAAFARMAQAAGFEVLEGPHRFHMPYGEGWPVSRPSLRALLTRAGREQALHAWKGDPHAALRARPRADR